MSPKRILIHTARQAWRLAVLVVGSTVVLLGVVMVVTPGPAIVVIPVGLAILGVEFAWARRLLAHVRERASDLVGRARRRAGKGVEPPPAPAPRDGAA